MPESVSPGVGHAVPSAFLSLVNILDNLRSGDSYEILRQEGTRGFKKCCSPSCTRSSSVTSVHTAVPKRAPLTALRHGATLFSVPQLHGFSPAPYSK